MLCSPVGFKGNLSLLEICLCWPGDLSKCRPKRWCACRFRYTCYLGAYGIELRFAAESQKPWHVKVPRDDGFLGLCQMDLATVRMTCFPLLGLYSRSQVAYSTGSAVGGGKARSPAKFGQVLSKKHLGPGPCKRYLPPHCPFFLLRVALKSRVSFCGFFDVCRTYEAEVLNCRNLNRSRKWWCFYCAAASCASRPDFSRSSWLWLSKPTVPFWGRCTTLFRTYLSGRDFDPWPVCRKGSQRSGRFSFWSRFQPGVVGMTHWFHFCASRELEKMGMDQN